MKHRRKKKADIIRWCAVVCIVAAVAAVASHFGKSDDKHPVNADGIMLKEESGTGISDAGTDMADITDNGIDLYGKRESYSGTELSGLKIVLDAGHGGKDDGTSAMGSKEKEINLGVEKKIAVLLEGCGAEIIETRPDDAFISLQGRVDIANKSSADVFVSVHCNYYEDDESMNGFQCFYGGGSVYGEELAKDITAAIEGAGICGTKNARPENYFVVCNTTMPSVLMELGYMSNRNECIKLLDDQFQEQMAESIVRGIIDWYGNMEK